MAIMNVTTSNSRIVKAPDFLSLLLLEDSGTFSSTAWLLGKATERHLLGDSPKEELFGLSFKIFKYPLNQ